VLLYETKDVSTVARNRADNVGGVRASDQPQPDGSDRASHNPVNIAATLGQRQHPLRFHMTHTLQMLSRCSASHHHMQVKNSPSVEELTAAISHGPALTR
jgi:hypothetical protein